MVYDGQSNDVLAMKATTIVNAPLFPEVRDVYTSYKCSASNMCKMNVQLWR